MINNMLFEFIGCYNIKLICNVIKDKIIKECKYQVINVCFNDVKCFIVVFDYVYISINFV